MSWLRQSLFCSTAQNSKLFFKSSLHTSSSYSIYQAPKHYFDTYQVRTQLEKAGFDHMQSEAIVELLSQVVKESTDGMLKNVKMAAYKVDFAQMKSEIQMIEKTDFSIMKAENEKLAGEVLKLKQRLGEEISKTQASVKLDMSLEKGRIRDEQASQEINIKKADAKIEKEILNLKTQIESIKLQILQYMFGTLTGAGALFLGKSYTFIIIFQHYEFSKT
ncbi:hypothetical protein BB561_003180 [Smittium simulii]|uniref:DUF1640 domain-containing protein n=1 Tax=Smittium simulii TaxID=133385 RepID=A0A2T9YMM9_9FUNG|nr:hypothetical protein BB561_003180 [Smittium simulii]